MTISHQEQIYDNLYKHTEYSDFVLDDKKITNGKNVYNKKISVLGAGTSRDIIYLLKGNDVWSYDSSKEAVKNNKRLGITSKLVDLNDPFTKRKINYFDIVVAKDILEHLNDPSVLMNEIYKMLKSSGYVVINVPNHFYLPMRLRILFGNNLVWKTFYHDHTKDFKEWNYMHKIFFTWKGFNEFVTENNFEIIKTFWDFGTLSHYSQPELISSYMRQSPKYKNNKILINVLEKCWQIFNLIIPRSIRSSVVSISPSLFSASFYVWCRKTN